MRLSLGWASVLPLSAGSLCGLGISRGFPSRHFCSLTSEAVDGAGGGRPSSLWQEQPSIGAAAKQRILSGGPGSPSAPGLERSLPGRLFVDSRARGHPPPSQARGPEAAGVGWSVGQLLALSPPGCTALSLAAPVGSGPGSSFWRRGITQQPLPCRLPEVSPFEDLPAGHLCGKCSPCPPVRPPAAG